MITRTGAVERSPLRRDAAATGGPLEARARIERTLDALDDLARGAATHIPIVRVRELLGGDA